jgi:hypothetical protein
MDLDLTLPVYFAEEQMVLHLTLPQLLGWDIFTYDIIFVKIVQLHHVTYMHYRCLSIKRNREHNQKWIDILSIHLEDQKLECYIAEEECFLIGKGQTFP